MSQVAITPTVARIPTAMPLAQNELHYAAPINTVVQEQIVSLYCLMEKNTRKMLARVATGAYTAFVP